MKLDNWETRVNKVNYKCIKILHSKFYTQNYVKCMWNFKIWNILVHIKFKIIGTNLNELSFNDDQLKKPKILEKNSDFSTHSANNFTLSV